MSLHSQIPEKYSKKYFYASYLEYLNPMISDVNSLLSIIVTRLLTYYLAIIYPLQYQNIITGNSVGSAQDNNPPTLVNCQQPEGNTTIIFVLSV